VLGKTKAVNNLNALITAKVFWHNDLTVFRERRKCGNTSIRRMLKCVRKGVDVIFVCGILILFFLFFFLFFLALPFPFMADVSSVYLYKGKFPFGMHFDCSLEELQIASRFCG